MRCSTIGTVSGVARVTKQVGPIVMCPGCRVQMGVRKVMPEVPGKAAGKIIYACEICKAETMRLYNKPKASSLEKSR